jgi:hypothetical protein
MTKEKHYLLAAGYLRFPEYELSSKLILEA